MRLTWRGEEAKTAMRNQSLTGLHLACEHLRGASQTQVPHDEGTLENTATVSIDETGLRGAVSYNTVYAARQHEEITWRHQHGRKAKYLEDPLREEAGTISRIIRKTTGTR